MSFRRQKGSHAPTPEGEAATPPGPAAVAEPQKFEELSGEIDELTRANRPRRDPEVERRILRLRHRAGLELIDHPAAIPGHPPPAFDLLPNGSELPEVEPGQQSPELLRAAVLRHGCLLIRGLLGRDEALRLAEDVDRAFEAREVQQSGGPAPGGYYEEFEPDPRFNLAAQRRWVTDAAGVWAADSPKVMFEMLDAFERTGLRRLATEYLGERPAISINKCTLRRVQPQISSGVSGIAWHQDGAFLGDVNALNIWLSLSHCGDEAPGLDIVPRRLDQIVPTGTEGAAFDWSVSPAVAEDAAGDVAILRPIFEPGDVLLFDEFFLHATAAEPDMPNTRHAIESWFFGPSGFPGEYAPLVF